MEKELGGMISNDFGDDDDDDTCVCCIKTMTYIISRSIILRISMGGGGVSDERLNVSNVSLFFSDSM